MNKTAKYIIGAFTFIVAIILCYYIGTNKKTTEVPEEGNPSNNNSEDH